MMKRLKDKNKLFNKLDFIDSRLIISKILYFNTKNKGTLYRSKILDKDKYNLLVQLQNPMT